MIEQEISKKPGPKQDLRLSIPVSHSQSVFGIVVLLGHLQSDGIETLVGWSRRLFDANNFGSMEKTYDQQQKGSSSFKEQIL